MQPARCTAKPLLPSLICPDQPVQIPNQNHGAVEKKKKKRMKTEKRPKQPVHHSIPTASSNSSPSITSSRAQPASMPLPPEPPLQSCAPSAKYQAVITSSALDAAIVDYPCSHLPIYGLLLQQGEKSKQN
jgi:hypothetical protein